MLAASKLKKASIIVLSVALARPFQLEKEERVV